MDSSIRGSQSTYNQPHRRPRHFPTQSNATITSSQPSAPPFVAAAAAAAADADAPGAAADAATLQSLEFLDLSDVGDAERSRLSIALVSPPIRDDDDYDYDDDRDYEDDDEDDEDIEPLPLSLRGPALQSTQRPLLLRPALGNVQYIVRSTPPPEQLAQLPQPPPHLRALSRAPPPRSAQFPAVPPSPLSPLSPPPPPRSRSGSFSSFVSTRSSSTASNSCCSSSASSDVCTEQNDEQDERQTPAVVQELQQEQQHDPVDECHYPTNVHKDQPQQLPVQDHGQQHPFKQEQQQQLDVGGCLVTGQPPPHQQQQQQHHHHHHIVNNGAAGGRIIVNLACIRPDLPYVIADSHHTSSPLNIVASADPIRVHYPPHATAAMTPHTNASGQSQQQATAQQQQRSTTPQQPQQQPSTASSATGGSTNVTPAPPSVAAAPPPQQQQQQQQQVPIYAQPPPAAVQGYGGAGVYQVVHGYMAHNAQQAPPQQQQQPPQHHYMSVNAAPFVPAEMQQQQQQQIEQIQPSSSNISHMRGGGGLRRGRVRSNGTHRREYSTRPPILPDVGLQQVTMEQQVSQHHQQQQHQQQHHHQQQQQHQHQQQQQHHHQQQQHQHQQQQHHQANLMQSSYAPYAAATAGGYQYYYTTAAQPGHMQVGFPSAQHATGSPLYASHPGAMHMYVQSPYYPYAPTGLVYPHMFNAAEYPTAVLMDGSAVAGAKDDVNAAGDANSGGNGGSQTPQPMWHPAQVQWHPAQGLPHGAVAAGQQIITGPGGEEYVQSLDEQQQQQLQQQQQQQQHQQQQQQQPQIDEYGNYAIDQPPPHMLSPIYAKDEHGGYVVHAPHHHQQQQQHHQHQLHQQHQHHQHLQQQQQQHHAEFIAAGGLNATAGAIHLSPQPLLDASQLPQVSQHQAAHHQQQQHQHQQHAHHAHPHGMHHAHPYHTLPPPQQQQQPGGHHPQHHIMMPVVMHPQDPNNGGMMLGHYVMAPPSGPPTQLAAPPPAALSEHGHLLVEQDGSDAQVVDGQTAGSVQILQQQQHENHLNNNHMVDMVEMAVDPHLHQQQQPSDGMLMVEPMSGEPVMVASGAPLVISTDGPIAGVLQAPVHGQPQHLVPSPVLFVPVQSNLPLPTPMQPVQQQQQPHYQQQQQQQAPSVSPVSSTSSSTLSSTNVMAPTAVAVEQPAAAPAAPATVHRNNPFSQPMPTNVNIKTAPLPVAPIVTPPLQSQATVISTEELDKLAKSTTEKLVIKSETTRTYNNNNLQSHANNHQQQQQQQSHTNNNNNNNNNNNYHKSSNNAWTPNHPKKNTANVSVSAVPMQTSTTQTAPNVLLPTPKQPLIANAPAMRAHYDTPQSHGGKNSYGQKSDKKVWNNNNNNHSHAEPAASHGHYAAKAAAAAVAPVPTPSTTVTVASTAAPPQVQQQQQPPQHHQQQQHTAQPEQRSSKQVEVNPLMLCTDAPVSATDIVVHPTVATVASTIAPQPSVVAAASNAAVPAKPEPEAIVSAPTAQLNVADKSTTTAAVAPMTAAPSTVRTSAAAAAAPVAVAPATASPPTWAGLFVNKQPAAGARVEAKRPAATPSAPSSSGKASPFDGKSEPALPHVYPLQGILTSQSVAPAAVNTSTVAPATNVVAAAAAPLTVAASTATSTAAAPSPTPSAIATAAASTTAAATPSSPAVAAPKAMSYSAASAQGLPVAAPAGKKASKAAAAAAAKPPAPSGEDASAIKLGEFFQKYTVNNAPISLRPRGLINRSNYCYMNASLQALVACPPFYNLLKSIPAQHVAALRAKATTPTIDAMIDLANEFSTLPPGSRLTVARKAGLGAHGGGKKDEVVYDLACDQPIEPTTIHKLWNSSRSEHEGRQEDAEEFLSYLLNKLNDEMLELKKLVEKPVPEANGEMAADENDDGDEWKHIDYKGHKGTVTRSTDFGNSPLSDIFRGTWRSRLQREGDTSADTLQPFFTLQLNIDKAASVREALDNFFGKDQLDGLTCSKTNQTVAAWQQMTLEKLPLVLVLHLKWFHYKIDGCTKIVKNVDFPIDLKIDSKIVSSKKYSQKQKQYRLFAVVYHDGKDASKGHYIIDAYHSGYSYWLRYDDSTVKPVSESHVLHPRQNRVPYLLYYRRSDMIGGGNSGGGGNGSATGGGATGSSSSASASGGNK